VNNGWIWWKSAEEYEHLRAEGLDFAVLDEAARMRRDAWFECIRPRLTDKRGKAIFLSTPSGLNWFYEIYMLGKIEDNNWESFTFPTWTNPYIPKEEIEDARKDMPERLFRQEYGAEFLSDLGAIFRFRRDPLTQQILNIKGVFSPPSPEERYVAGVDLGKRHSFTVIFILDSEGQVVAWDRFKTVDWPLQVRRVAALAREYNNARMLIDSTGLGDPVYDFLRETYANVTPFVISPTKRRPLIDNLALMIEKVELSWPDIPELLRELQTFGIERSRAGHEKYSTPKGFTDDCVMALALAAWQLRRGTAPGIGYIPW
jgi:hypothetical protein